MSYICEVTGFLSRTILSAQLNLAGIDGLTWSKLSLALCLTVVTTTRPPGIISKSLPKFALFTIFVFHFESDVSISTGRTSV
ncbi:hypothetical protein ACN38_g9553 [Penicillium nordicum]|uniref:Uncharacterized protein n=1 Tax=Penicillium nordicum TaxID=229535 RepID=A0A0M9WCG7_9EURO|nr:hypothetical protein ACN38_g9553 [Penicillium nordicum]